MTDRRAVESFYSRYLDRDADAAGVDFWLSTGLSLDEIEAQFLAHAVARHVSVVVIDTGYAFSGGHVFEWDFADGDADASNSVNHGGLVAETLRHAAPGVNVIHLKVTDDNDLGGAARSVTEQALDWVLEHAEEYNIVAANLSLSSGHATEPVEHALSDEFAAMRAAGIAPVVAAGNDGDGTQHVGTLSADPNAVAVSALSIFGGVASWAQYHDDLTDVYALGEFVPYQNPETGAFGVNTGSSFAAPTVAAEIAQIQGAHYEETGALLPVDDVLEFLV